MFWARRHVIYNYCALIWYDSEVISSIAHASLGTFRAHSEHFREHLSVSNPPYGQPVTFLNRMARLLNHSSTVHS